MSSPLPALGRVALVAAHPDDETLGLGGQLAGFAQLILVHLTDGSPRDGADARRGGFASREAYARARAGELRRALEAAQARPAMQLNLGCVDQEAVLHLERLARELAGVLSGCDAVVTHPYEGGHPDHDAAAFAVWSACELLRRRHESPPERWEFASYHARGEGVAWGEFAADAGYPEWSLELSAAQRARRYAALAEFHTQAAVIAPLRDAPERVRRAPAYDFLAGPPPGQVLYDRFGWRMSSPRWRTHAALVLERLGLGGGRRSEACGDPAIP